MASSSSSSSSPPSWVVFGRIGIVDAAAVGQGSGGDVAVTLSQGPRVSPVAISPRILPEAIKHRDPNNPSILAVDPSGLLLIHVIIRRATDSEPVIVNPLGRARYVLRSGFLTSYLVVDTTTNAVYHLPEPSILKDSARVGILHPPSGFGGYLVAELKLTPGSNEALLLCFDSYMNRWTRNRVPFPIASGRFNPDCVLSHNGRLWWVDLSVGLIAWNPLTKPPALVFVGLPPAFDYSGAAARAGAPDLARQRCVRVSNGKLRFVNMDDYNKDDNGRRKFSVWTLQPEPKDSTPTSTNWLLQYEATFQQIWEHKSYTVRQLPKRVPVLAFIHPMKPQIYFFLEKRLFGIDLGGHSPVVVDCSDYQPVAPSSDLVSSRYFHAWEHEPQHTCPTFLDSKPQGSEGGVNPRYLQGESTHVLFNSLYGGCLRGQQAVETVNNFSGKKGQTMDCASRALDHWNALHGTSYEIDMTDQMDSNAFHQTSRRRFDVEKSYFHVNFYGKSSGPEKEKQLFFAELNGDGGPDTTITVESLGQDEDAVIGSSGEHICQCCTGLMHPYSTSFLGREASASLHH